MGGHHQRASSGRVHHGQDHQASFWAGSLGIAPAPQGRHRPTWDELAWGCSPPPGAQPASQAALVRRRGVVLTPGMPLLSPSARRTAPGFPPQSEGALWHQRNQGAQREFPSPEFPGWRPLPLPITQGRRQRHFGASLPVSMNTHSHSSAATLHFPTSQNGFGASKRPPRPPSASSPRPREGR